MGKGISHIWSRDVQFPIVPPSVSDALRNGLGYRH